MHVSHPSPSYLQDERLRDHVIHTELSRKAANYHKIATKMTVQFPELRLIQYDCGKWFSLSFIQVFSSFIFIFRLGFLSRVAREGERGAGLPRSGKNIWTMKFFQGQGKVREFCEWSGKFRKDLESPGI